MLPKIISSTPNTAAMAKFVESTSSAFCLFFAPKRRATRLPEPTPRSDPIIIISISSEAFTLTAAVACVPSELTKYVSARL